MKNPLFAVSLVLLLCFAFGCQNKAEKAELEKFRAQAKVEEQNKALVKPTLEAWSKGEFEVFRETVASNVVWYMPSRTISVRSAEELIEAGKMVRNGFPDITFSIEEIFAVGDRVIFRYIEKGTHLGEYAGIPATGNKYEISGIDIWRFENGKVVEVRSDNDMLGIMMQLGMELKPKESEKK
jgi:steroid delta-isomerase-like uncharacterized protein